MLHTEKHETQYMDCCPAGCDAQLIPSGIVLPEGPIIRCSNCGHMIFQMTQKEYDDSMTGFNKAQNTGQPNQISGRYMRRSKNTLKKASSMIHKPFSDIKLLDVGCSSGNFIKAAKMIGIDAQGVEPAIEAVKTAQSFGLKVDHGFLEDICLPEKSFDVVTLFEVIEHLNEPAKLLKEIKRVLCPNGLLIIRTGNADSWTVTLMKEKWDYFCPQIGHISFFNKVSMKNLADRCGFSIEKIRFHSISLCKKEDVSKTIYRVTKLIAELLNFPSKIFGKSHEMEVFLRIKDKS